jgi:hypothetical protein
VETVQVAPLATLHWGDTYYLIALSLNALLTLMVVMRLVLHGKKIRRAMGDQDGATELYKKIAIILVESGALYAASFVMVAGSWASRNLRAQSITSEILLQVQVRTGFSLP